MVVICDQNNKWGSTYWCAPALGKLHHVMGAAPPRLKRNTPFLYHSLADQNLVGMYDLTHDNSVIPPQIQ